MEARIKVIETNEELSKRILREIVDIMNGVLVKARYGIERRMQVVIKDALKAEPEYESLIGKIQNLTVGKNPSNLLGEFGLDDVSKVERILDYWAKSFRFFAFGCRIVGTSITGGYQFAAIESGYNDVLTLDDAVQITEIGQTLNWLEWLLLEGNNRIVLDYVVRVRPGRYPQSRSKTDTIMVQKKRSYWSVPAIHQGTIDNNWVTRAMAKIPDDTVAEIIVEEIEKQL